MERRVQCQVEEIDNQHKHLFDLTNELHRLVQAHATDTELLDTIKHIIDKKAAHFATEERYFHQFEFEETKAHEQLHVEFSRHIDDLQREYAHDVPILATKMVDFLALWFVGHLMGVDQKYTKCFNEHGLH